MSHFAQLNRDDAKLPPYPLHEVMEPARERLPLAYAPGKLMLWCCNAETHQKHTFAVCWLHKRLLCRYDDMKTAQENIDLQTTILSRFDLIFIVKDERSMDRDKQIARHVLNVHKNAGAALEVDEEEKKVSGQA